MAKPQKKNPRPDVAELVRVEPNMERLPFFSARRASDAEAGIFVWAGRGRDPLSGKPVRQKVTLRAAAGLHLPGNAERDLYYLVLAPMIDENGFDERGGVGPISYREACGALGITKCGPNYERIRESLETLASTAVKFEFCVIDRSTGEPRLLTCVDHICSVQMYDEQEADFAKDAEQAYGLRRGEFRVQFADWYVENYAANYCKPLDIQVYRALPKRAGIAKNLLSYLDRVAYDTQAHRLRDEWAEPLEDLAQRFQVSAETPKKTAHVFRKAHAELCKHWTILQEARVDYVGNGRYVCVYRFGGQQRLPLVELDEVDVPAVANERDELLDELLKRGVARVQAQIDVRKYPSSLIRRHLDIFDEELRAGVSFTNPGGRLHQWIAKDLPAFEGYKPPEARKKLAKAAAERAAEDRRKTDEMLAAAEREKALPPEERAEKRTAARVLIIEGLQKRSVSDAERKSLYETFLAEFTAERASD